LAVAVLALGLQLAQVTRAAPADASVDGCPMGYVCPYKDSDARPRPFMKLPASSAGAAHFGKGSISNNDEMSSWVNNSGVKFCWYLDTNFLPYYGTRGPRPIPPEPYRVVNLTRFENDEASSIHRAGIPGC
jgi:Peptidase inhibitor family I36